MPQSAPSAASRPQGPTLAEVEALLTQAPHRVIKTEPGWTRAAVAAVFRTGEHGTELLFIQRAAHPDDPWSGQIGFPGGRVEETDEHGRGTARRETLEEVGLDLAVTEGGRYLGPLHEIQARSRQELLSMVISPHAFVLDDISPPQLVLNYEVATALWVPLSRLASDESRTWHHAERDRTPYRFRAIDLGLAVPLWGITHRMTVEILGRLGLVDDVDHLTLPQLKR